MGVVLLAFLLRLASVPLVHAEGYLPDEREYVGMAHRLVQGGPFVDSNGFRSVRGPLYPFMLTGLFLLTGPSVRAAHAAGCLLGAASVYLVFLLTLRIWRDPRSALLAALITAVHPSLVIYGALLQTEAMYIVLLLAIFLLAIDFVEAPSIARAAAAGFLAGLASLTRPVFLGFFPLFFVVLGLAGDRKGRPLLALGALVALLTIAPWTLRNWAIHGELVLISSGGGSSLLTGNNPYATGTWRLESGFDEWFAARAKEMGVPDPAGLGETALGNVGGRIAAEYIAGHPGEVANLALKKTHVFWVYPVTHTDSGEIIQSVAVASDFALWIGVVFGLVAGRGSRRWLLAIALAGLYFWLVQVVLHSEARFRLPLVPLLAVVAGEGFHIFLDRDLRRKVLNVPALKWRLVAGMAAVGAAYGVTAWMVMSGTL